MSIGIGDTVADAATGAKIGAIIDTAKEDVKRIIEQFQVRHERGGAAGWRMRCTGTLRALCRRAVVPSSALLQWRRALHADPLWCLDSDACMHGVHFWLAAASRPRL